MKRTGLMTLADLPGLAAGKKPTSTIVVARLDDRLKDPRYGSFKIAQSDVDGWQRNLSGTFGGRVAIDADHSSDRGGGTRAMGWITDISQDGKLITADVEWTPRGAKAIRNGDYRHISPTFVNQYVDEHGDKQGKALIGAALTNRPVLRAGMPTLSLSRETFDASRWRSRRSRRGRRSRFASSLPASQSQSARSGCARWRSPPALNPAKRRSCAETRTLNTDVTERAKLMAGDVDPELRRMFLAQTLNSEPEPSTGSAPLAVDDERYELHQEAKQLAQARCDANPRLDPAEEYADAAARLLDRGGAVI